VVVGPQAVAAGRGPVADGAVVDGEGVGVSRPSTDPVEQTGLGGAVVGVEVLGAGG
jgi:hypothetical protein